MAEVGAFGSRAVKDRVNEWNNISDKALIEVLKAPRRNKELDPSSLARQYQFEEEDARRRLIDAVASELAAADLLASSEISLTDPESDEDPRESRSDTRGVGAERCVPWVPT